MTPEDRRTLIHALADGRFLSGEALAKAAGCSRTAIWKRLQRLTEVSGLQVDAVRGRGYRLTSPLSLLDTQQLEARLTAKTRECLHVCEVHDLLDSTNARAKTFGLPAQQPAALVVAEYQSAGRGRRGRTWVSPFGQNLYFSLAYRFELPMAQLSGLSLAVGVVLAEQLQAMGVEDVGLKWPNDLYLRDAKLGGILLEASGEASGPVTAIIGIGVNLTATPEMSTQIDQPFTCLQEAGMQLDRTELVADLANALVAMCEQYQSFGLSSFVERWQSFDVFRDRLVTLAGPGFTARGRALGISNDGGLRLQTPQGVQVLHAGEISLRADAQA